MERQRNHNFLTKNNLKEKIATIALATSLAVSIGAAQKSDREAPLKASYDNIEKASYDFRRLSGEHGGAWSFFGDPRSISVGDDVYTGWIARNGFVQISQYDTKTHKEKTKTLGPNLGRVDDHNNPSLIARKDGRIMTFYSPHSGRSLPKNATSHMYYRTTKEPNDITKWGPIHRVPVNSPGGLGYTYPNPVVVEKGNVWMTWRGGNWQPTAATTPDHGKSWSSARTILRAGGKKRPYIKVAEGPNESVAMAYNQDNPGTTGTGLYYLQYKPGQGFYKANGKKVANSHSTVPISKGDMIMSRHKHGRAYVMDVAVGKDGKPATVFTGKPRSGAASVYYSHWNGKHWDIDKLTSVGYNLFSKHSRPKHYGFYPTAGASLDHGDTSTVYLSRQVDHQLRVEKWKQEDGKWSHEFISPKEKSCVRPASVRGLGEKVVMMCGDYTNWLKFKTSIYIAEPKTEG